MTDCEKYTKASRELNVAINNVSKKYKLNNVEILGLLNAICVALVQIFYTPKGGRK